MKKRIAALILAALLPSASIAQPAESVKAPSSQRQSVLRLTPLEIVAITGGAIVLAGAFDRKVQEHYGPDSKSKSTRNLRKAGDIGQLAGPIAGTIFLLQGAAGHNVKSHETGILLYESFLISGAASGVLKFATGRKRPSKTTEPFSFKPAGHDGSFPSGHTTTAFAAAEVLSEQYPHWWISVPAYGGAAAVGLSRIRANQHWLSDVVAGAAVGISTSHLLRFYRRSSEKNGDSALLFDGEQLSWMKRF